jgi:DNA invertase Pin-like site-specific DNA recombinase
MRSGDFCCIEDYDRFSREDPITSLSALRKILKDKKITIVFLSEGVEVNQDNFLDDNIILPLFLKGFLGFRENTKKGERVSKAWIAKHQEMKLGKHVATTLPCWLEFTNNKYSIIESAAKVIRRMFCLCNEGKGSGEIAKLLNTEKVRPISKRKKQNGFNQRFILNCLTGLALKKRTEKSSHLVSCL